jgi:hypothetical protein
MWGWLRFLYDSLIVRVLGLPLWLWILISIVVAWGIAQIPYLASLREEIHLLATFMVAVVALGMLRWRSLLEDIKYKVTV